MILINHVTNLASKYFPEVNIMKFWLDEKAHCVSFALNRIIYETH